MNPPSREACEALDAADPLAPFRARFVIADEQLLYMDGNSLGRLPVATRARLHAFVDAWGDRLVTGWQEWLDAPARVGDRVAAGVLGAADGEVVVSDSTTVNLYKLCSAVLESLPREGRRAVVTDRDNFPTDRYVLEGLCARHGLELRMMECDPLAGPQAADLERAVGGAALVLLSQVAYRSGALADMAGLTALCRAHGTPVVWDLCHSVGALPIDLHADGVELAVGCTYKYLNGGPGAPAFLYVARALQDRLRSPIAGWFSQEDQFAMGPGYRPVPGIARFLAGTPAVLDLEAVDEGVALTAEAGLDRLRAKSLAQTELAIALHDAWLAPLGFTLGTPREPALRGSHVSLRHADAWPICRALIERADVVPDFRGPDSIRIGIAPLYTRFVDVWDALDRLRRLVDRGEHRLVDRTVSRVT